MTQITELPRVQLHFFSEGCDLFTQGPFRSTSLTEDETEEDMNPRSQTVFVNVSVCSLPVRLFALRRGVGKEAVCCMFYCVLNFKARFLINAFWNNRPEG